MGLCYHQRNKSISRCSSPHRSACQYATKCHQSQSSKSSMRRRRMFGSQRTHTRAGAATVYELELVRICATMPRRCSTRKIHCWLRMLPPPPLLARPGQPVEFGQNWGKNQQMRRDESSDLFTAWSITHSASEGLNVSLDLVW